MQPRTAKLLHDCLTAATRIEALIGDKTFEDYAADEVFRLALERLFEIAGESLNQAVQRDESIRTMIPEAGEVIGMRNRIIHGYDTIDDESIWETAVFQVPTLREGLQATLDRYPPEEIIP